MWRFWFACCFCRMRRMGRTWCASEAAILLDQLHYLLRGFQRFRISCIWIKLAQHTQHTAFHTFAWFLIIPFLISSCSAIRTTGLCVAFIVGRWTISWYRFQSYWHLERNECLMECTKEKVKLFLVYNSPPSIQIITSLLLNDTIDNKICRRIKLVVKCKI